MNTPNKLTVLRMILVPFFLLFLLVESIPFHGLWALLIFAAASFTDAMDGHIARSRNLVTDFGKFLDPVADKVLTFSALIAFIELGCASSVAVVIMMAREFLVSSLRMVAAGNGTDGAAGKLGKLKTAVTMAKGQDWGTMAEDYRNGKISDQVASIIQSYAGLFSGK